MNIFDKIKISTNRVLNNIFKVSSVETLEYQKRKMEDVLEEANHSLNNLKGKNKQKEEELKENEVNLVTLLSMAKTWKKDLEKKDSLSEKRALTEALQRSCALHDQTEKENEMLKKQITINNKIISDIEKKIELYSSKIDDINKNIDVLKAKAEYAENIKNFKKISKSLECDANLKNIEKDIDAEYFTAEFELQELDEKDVQNQDIEGFIENNTKEDKFSVFLNKLDNIK